MKLLILSCRVRFSNGILTPEATRPGHISDIQP